METAPRQAKITITPRATRLMTANFKNREIQPVRLFVRLGACGLRTFGLALEPARASDKVFRIDGFTYVINRKLFDLVQPITVDADTIMFRVSGRGVPPPNGCGNCGNMCGIRGGNRCPGDCGSCQFQCGYGRQFHRGARTTGADAPTEASRDGRGRGRRLKWRQ
jgi:Fe-S cluster assembly iron-binding protein IscA